MASLRNDFIELIQDTFKKGTQYLRDSWESTMIIFKNSLKYAFKNFSRKTWSISTDYPIDFARISSKIFINNVFKNSSNNFLRDPFTNLLEFPPELWFHTRISLRIPTETTPAIVSRICSESPVDFYLGISQ